MTTPPTEPFTGDGRVLVAFDSQTLDWTASPWTALDDYPGVRVAQYQIDRGRQVELDRTDAGHATVELFDRDGVLDPTNAAGPFYGRIEPLLQVGLRRYNPLAAEWQTRFRGWVEDIDYSFDPSQQVNRLTITLVDIFEVLSAIEMMPGQFGVDPSGPDFPAASAGNVVYGIAQMDERITAVLGNALIPDDWYVVFSGNVELYGTVYSPGESAMTAIQEAADAEFPGVSNVYVDRFGRLAVHGRLAKFDPSGVLAGAAPGSWPWHSWNVGDGAAVNAAPTTTAHLREFGMSRGLTHVINQAYATPNRQLTQAQTEAQLVQDATSIGLRGIRPWSAQQLLTKRGILDDADDLTETRRFAQYYVDNYAVPRERSTGIGFRTIPLSDPGAGRTWRLLSEVDIADAVLVTIASPGGGGFAAEPYFVEGIHEVARPATPQFDDVTLTLDVSPQALYTSNPFPTP